MLRRTLATGATTAGALLLFAAPAAAHVTVSAPDAQQGGFATVTFSVPNERDDSGTNRLEVTMPEDHPLAFVSVEPVPGWTVDVERTPPDQPVEAEGEEVTEAVSKVTWQGGPVAPGQFQQFVVSAGPLPDDVDRLEFPTLQTYEDGEVVRWIESTPPGGEEPENPAPTLELTSASDDGDDGTTATTAADTSPQGGNQAAQIADVGDDADTAKTLGIVGIVVGAVGLLVGLGALAASRRRPAGAPR